MKKPSNIENKSLLFILFLPISFGSFKRVNKFKRREKLLRGVPLSVWGSQLNVEVLINIIADTVLDFCKHPSIFCVIFVIPWWPTGTE